jgi:hypothetical protein
MRVDSGRRPALAGMRKKGVLNRGAAQQTHAAEAAKQVCYRSVSAVRGPADT